MPGPFLYDAEEQMRPISRMDFRPRLPFRFNRKIFDRAVKVEVAYRKLTGKGGEIERLNKAALKWVQVRAAQNLQEKMARNKRPAAGRSRRLEKAIMSPKYSTVKVDGFNFMEYSSGILQDVPYWLAVEYGSYASVGRYLPLSFLGQRPGVGLHGLPNVESRAKDLTQPYGPERGRSNALRATRAYRPGPGNRPRGTYLPKGLRGIARHAGQDGYRRATTDRIIGPSERLRKEAKGEGFRQLHSTTVTFVRIKNPVPAYHYARDAARAFKSEDIYSRSMKASQKNLTKKLGIAAKRSMNFTGRKALSSR